MGSLRLGCHFAGTSPLRGHHYSNKKNILSLFWRYDRARQLSEISAATACLEYWKTLKIGKTCKENQKYQLRNASLGYSLFPESIQEKGFWVLFSRLLYKNPEKEAPFGLFAITRINSKKQGSGYYSNDYCTKTQRKKRPFGYPLFRDSIQKTRSWVLFYRSLYKNPQERSAF